MNQVVVKEKVDIGNKLSFLSTKKCGKKNAKKVAGFGLNSRKSLRKAKSLFRYFKAFWLQSGIADWDPNKKI